jgi:hypothetical protein
MRALVQDKYALRDLHREIDLLDRKLNHTMKHQSFETEEERAAAVRKLTVRRDQHVVLAQSLIDLGIEYHPSEVPPSLRTPEQIASLEADAQATPDVVAQVEAIEEEAPVARPDPTDFGAMVSRLERENSMTSSPLAAWKDDLAAYRRRRQKAQSA